MGREHSLIPAGLDGPEEPSGAERRRAVRYHFGGVAEVIDVASEAHLIGSASVLGLYGCFVNTRAAFGSGTRVKLRITNGDAEFASLGGVVHATNEGMGIVFGDMGPDEKAVLEHWLSQVAQEA